MAPRFLRSVTQYTIEFNRIGCRGRPFYTLVVTNTKRVKSEYNVVETLGSFDPIPNENNEKLVALNLERLQYWTAKDVSISNGASSLLGLSGFLPVHPKTYFLAKRRRAVLESVKLEREQQKLKTDSSPLS